MPVQREASFAEILGNYVNQHGYTIGQLARLSAIPKRTVANWLEDIVKKPRDWRALVNVAAALHLDETEATRLLQAAGHPGIAQLLAQTDNESDLCLVTPWAETIQRRLAHSPFQVIADLPHFAGRQREIEALKRALLAAPPVKLCSLYGMAGVGKTTLASHLAYQLRPYFPDGVLWARLDNADTKSVSTDTKSVYADTKSVYADTKSASADTKSASADTKSVSTDTMSVYADTMSVYADTMSILSSFARAYGLDVAGYKNLESRSRVVRELLAPKRVLIVLDNVESSDQVQPLLPSSGACAVLLTSRRHDLAVTRGARRFQLGPFEQQEESLELFANLLGEEYVKRESEPLLEMAVLLGDLPLALDIAASRLAHEPGWSATDFLARLRREESRLSELVYENQSVRLSFNLSYQRLSTEQQRIFHALGAFGGEDFSLEAAAYVAAVDKETAADHLRNLYALSLVQVGRLGRYRLHPLLRNLALAGASGDDALRRMVAFFTQVAEAQYEAYDALDLEISNLLVALQVAFECNLNADLIRGAKALSNYLDVRGLYPQAELHLGRAIRAAESLEDQTAQVALLCKLGLALIHYGRLTIATQRLQEGLELTRRAELHDEISTLILGYLGLVAYFRSDYEQMEQYLLEALALARTLHQDETVCRLLEGLNEIAQRRGNYATAEAYCREGLALARRLENPELISLLLKSLANVIFERGGDHTEVNACLQESLALACELGHPRIICTSLLSLGYITCEHGDYETADKFLQQALGLMQGIDFPIERVFILCTLGLAARGRQMYEQAANYLHEGLALARQVEMTVLTAPIQNAWGWLHFEQQAWEAAAEAFFEALQISRQTGVRVQIAQALYGLARVAAAQGDLATAGHNGKKSLAILEAIGHRTRADVQAWLLELG